jgi:all-trans-8'-apo-beta-carotenal 15,15'-oxygenase
MTAAAIEPHPTREPAPVAPVRQGGGWARSFRDLPREHGFEPLRVEGTLPADLEGTFYKNGAGRFSAGGERYGHWFDADGAVTGVRLQGGKAWGGVRLVRTPGLARQDRGGRRIFGGYNTPFPRPVRELFLKDKKNPANTSVMLWQGRLFATCEVGYPFEIDRESLATLGERDLGGVLVEAFSAHPHDVPARRAFFNFGLANGRSARITAYELPYTGRPRRITSFALPGPTTVHDFAATERYLIFSLAPMRIKLLPVLSGKAGAMDAMEWRSEKGTQLVVVPIDDPGATFRIEVEAHMLEHVANAFEQGGTVQVDFTRYPDLRGLEDYVGSLHTGTVRVPLASSLTRAVIDPARRTARFEPRLVAPCELPRVSPRVDAAPHRFVYLAGYRDAASARTSFFDAVLKLDVDKGTVEKFVPEAGCYCSEALFVPRRGGSAEDDGYLLTMLYDAPSDQSSLAILDARTPSAPPIARASFDHAIPPGFHAVWTG